MLIPTSSLSSLLYRLGQKRKGTLAMPTCTCELSSSVITTLPCIVPPLCTQINNHPYCHHYGHSSWRETKPATPTWVSVPRSMVTCACELSSSVITTLPCIPTTVYTYQQSSLLPSLWSFQLKRNKTSHTHLSLCAPQHGNLCLWAEQQRDNNLTLHIPPLCTHINNHPYCHHYGHSSEEKQKQPHPPVSLCPAAW